MYLGKYASPFSKIGKGAIPKSRMEKTLKYENPFLHHNCNSLVCCAIIGLVTGACDIKV